MDVQASGLTSAICQCSSAVSPIDAFLALDFFGFPPLDLKITCADDDPLKTSKTMAFAAFLKGKKSVPTMVKYIKDTMHETPALSYHFIVSSPESHLPSSCLLRHPLLTLMPA